MKPTRTLSSYVLLIGVLGLSIVGGVLAYQIYSAAVKSQTTTAQSLAIKPIDGAIDPSVIDNLKERTVYTDSQLMETIETVVTPTATAAAEITPTEATESGEVTP
jgi:hypothetical protein